MQTAITTTGRHTANDLSPLIDMVLNAVGSDHTRRSYEAALLGRIGADGIMGDDRGFLVWFLRSPHQRLNKAAVADFRQHLIDEGVGHSSVNIRLAAVRKLAREAADNGILDFDTVAAIRRVPNFKREGQRLGNWLDVKAAAALIKAPIGCPKVHPMRQLRDRALLAIPIGCGLRRQELVDLTVAHVQQREGRWVLVNIIGKRGRVRSVPAPAWAIHYLQEWTTAAGIEDGYVFRPCLRGGRLQEGGISCEAIRNCVKQYGKRIGAKGLAPHDLRRTFARLSHNGGADIRQIQLSLGHSSIETTERYIGSNQSLTSAPCDFLGLKL